MNDFKLNEHWNLWYHSIEDTSWNNESYQFLYKIKNLYDIKFLKDYIQQNYLQNGMFFIMKDNIFPTWEDPDNRDGMSISFKIPASNLHVEWNNFIERVLTENILKMKQKKMKLMGYLYHQKRV